MTKQSSGGKDKMDKKWKTAQKEKTLREGLTSMLCFQMALCLAAAGVFFAAVRLGGGNEEAAKKTARLLCQEQPLSVDTENMEQLWQQFCGFWQGGAGHILEEIRDFVAKQIVSPEQLPEPDGALEAQYQALVRALDADRRAQLTRSQQGYQELVEYYTVWAHQIKTPIAAMRLRLQSEDSDSSRRLLTDLGRIEQYVEMVLTYLRLEGEGTDYVFREAKLDDIVRPALRRFAGEFIARRLTLDYTPTDVRVFTDEKWLSFVIEQVLSNALKYTPQGGVSVYVEEPKTLCIRDTGIGIAPEDLPRVFERGYTGLQGRADKRASGIGLYLCRRICRNLGHTITAESRPGEGTTVRIKLEEKKITVE